MGTKHFADAISVNSDENLARSEKNADKIEKEYMEILNQKSNSDILILINFFYAP